MRLKGPSLKTTQKLRTPVERLAFTFQGTHRQATSSVFADNFQARWNRCFSVRGDVAQAYADQIEATYYQREELDHLGVNVSSFVLGKSDLLNPRLAFEECVASLKVTVKLMSDCEPPAVLPLERARLEAEILEAEKAFVEFEDALTKLEPAHLLLQRHFDQLRCLTQPRRPRETLYEAAGTEERARLDGRHESAMKSHLTSLLALAEVRDECFVRVSAASVHGYLDQADQLYADQAVASKDSRRSSDDELRLELLRDELEVVAVMLELESESAS